MEHQYFKRARAMFAAIKAIMLLPITAQQAELTKLGPYRSRGKGRSTPPRNFHGHTTPWHNNKSENRECARRLRQMAKGIIEADGFLVDGKFKPFPPFPGGEL